MKSGSYIAFICPHNVFSVLCQTVKDLTLSVEAEDKKKNDSCQTLKEKLSSLLESLEYESEAAEQSALEGEADDWVSAMPSEVSC